VTKALLACGASIGEINCVRKHLSAIKGGRLALAAAPARVLTLAISDVPGDDLSTIASGPTVPDPTTCADALEIVERYAIDLAAGRARTAGQRRRRDAQGRRPRFRALRGAGHRHAQAVLAAAAERPAPGPDAAGAGRRHRGRGARSGARAGRHRAFLRRPRRAAAGPCVLLSGGETTVTVRGRGRGGRNAEFLLGLALALNGHPRIHAIAGDTDGIDGSEDNAGALLMADTRRAAAAAGIDLRARLTDNDAYGVFAALATWSSPDRRAPT
jgi:glycerate 2-kinase